MLSNDDEGPSAETVTAELNRTLEQAQRAANVIVADAHRRAASILDTVEPWARRHRLAGVDVAQMRRDIDDLEARLHHNSGTLAALIDHHLAEPLDGGGSPAPPPNRVVAEPSSPSGVLASNGVVGTALRWDPPQPALRVHSGVSSEVLRSEADDVAHGPPTSGERTAGATVLAPETLWAPPESWAPPHSDPVETRASDATAPEPEPMPNATTTLMGVTWLRSNLVTGLVALAVLTVTLIIVNVV